MGVAGDYYLSGLSGGTLVAVGIDDLDGVLR